MDDRRLLNHMTPGAKRADLGGRLLDLEAKAEALPATNVTIAADTDNGVAAADLQTAFEALAARVQALEDAP